MKCTYILYSDCGGSVWTSRTVCTDGMFSYKKYELIEQQYCTLLRCTADVLSVFFCLFVCFSGGNVPHIYPDVEDAVEFYRITFLCVVELIRN